MNHRVDKISDKPLKESIRGGSKFQNQSIITEPDEYIKPFLNAIICADSHNILQQLPDNSIDMIITSPPYNFGHSYANDPKQDTAAWNEFFAKLKLVWQECYRVLKPGGRIAVNIQPLFSDYIPTHHIISNQLLQLGFLWKCEILWEKNNWNAKYTAWGSWKSPSMPYLKYTWEFIEVFCKESHKKPGERSLIDITDLEFKEFVKAKWSVGPEKRMQQFGHPAMFPEEIPKRLMKLFSYQHDVILDPFNGVGTTTLVAAQHHRYFIGIENSPEYCQTALRRIQDACPSLHVRYIPPES